MTEESNLLSELGRRNWIIFALLLTGSLVFQNAAFTLGVLSGGLVAVAGYRWLHRALTKMLNQPGGGSTKGFQAGYVVRLTCLATALYLLVAIVKVHPIGLALGLSVVLLNILWTTLKRAF